MPDPRGGSGGSGTPPPFRPEFKKKIKWFETEILTTEEPRMTVNLLLFVKLKKLMKPVLYFVTQLNTRLVRIFIFLATMVGTTRTEQCRAFAETPDISTS